jgi:anhydro-N-acetylmuramic acid kinase
MTGKPVLGVGLMSGTSLDGMDAALVRIAGPDRAELVAFHCRAYTTAERSAIEWALDRAGAAELARLHVRLAGWAGDAVESVLQVAHIRPGELGFIAFPGQTIWHEPPVVTWQLGSPAVLAERFGVPVVSDFRSRDVAAGGQGAPLVPVADVLLFGAADHARVLLNLGGMANLTYVRRRGVEDGAFAFDTGPGVAVIDAVARLVSPGLAFDVDGRLARAGTVNETVLAELLGDPFFASPPPKSTGRERFGATYAAELHARVPGADGVATAVELTARTVADAIGRWVPAAPEVVMSGGGVRNPALMAALTRCLSRGPAVRLFDELFFSGDAKEAVAFALLGYLTIHGQPGNLPAATGAAGRRVLGSVTPA